MPTQTARSTDIAPARPRHHVRIVTAASLFDGHDAAINIMRRIIQATGCEVIHLGHNRSVDNIVTAAIQEDAQGIAISSYQGGHMEFFRYARDLLIERGAGHIRIFGGGGGTIIPAEKQALEAYGITAIYHPEDGRLLGLQGMINHLVGACDHSLIGGDSDAEVDVDAGDGGGLRGTGLASLLQATDVWTRTRILARGITLAEAVAAERVDGDVWQTWQQGLDEAVANSMAPVIGFTGTGGAGKSSLVDEIVRRFAEDFPHKTVAILSVDPTKQRTGGALLGDRIRMNALDANTRTPGRLFMRSLATRGSGSAISAALVDAIRLCKAAGFDLIVAETSGIGQADSSIVKIVDYSVYVMTPEFGAQSQLEKIEMIDLADMVVVNKFDKPGALDAIRDVKKAYQRAHGRFGEDADAMPVLGAMASQFNDRGCNAVYTGLLDAISGATGGELRGRYTDALPCGLPDRGHLIPPRRVRYLAEIVDAVRAAGAAAAEQAEHAGQLWAIARCIRLLDGAQAESADNFVDQTYTDDIVANARPAIAELMQAWNDELAHLTPASRQLLAEWPELQARYRGEINQYTVRGRQIEVQNHTTSLAGQALPKVAVPRVREWGQALLWRLTENLPGYFPFAAGVFAFKRRGEDPTRMFAGEGGPWRTNARFHFLSKHSAAKRLSTAFDSVTLYGEDPDPRPDIWGKVGNSGVSVATVEDMEALYAGFDLCDPATSVSMTINGPAPTILAFYFNTAIRQQMRRFLRDRGDVALSDAECLQPGAGGLSFDELRARVTDTEYAELTKRSVTAVRGTVQADILKEDQAQNTCIFSTEFALKMMGDVQQWFIDHAVRNFYSVSISGYHIAEAGANPITQLAFTLANGFTFIEYYRARGMDVDRFAGNFSFFFSNGMDPEYAVIGRVARRIWAIALRDLYGAGERAQKLKYHVQTSGRSLHAQEIAFNDIRTTLQALLAVYDNCNSLHTNAYDEAVTTPTEESVRRALAIQLIINQEFGVARNENPNQGAFIIDELTDLVQEAVLLEFERLSERGGVLGAMERMYQRGRIQDESLFYEHQKHTGELPIVGVNTFTSPTESGSATPTELIRSSDAEKQEQLDRLRGFQSRHADRAAAAAQRLKDVAIAGGNVFDELMSAVQVLSLGQVSRALYDVGGQYRRSM